MFPEFYVPDFRTPGAGPEVTQGIWKRVTCGVCGQRPVGRVGSISVRFTRKGDVLDWVRTAEGILIHRQVVDHLTEARLVGWRAGIVAVDAGTRVLGQDLAYHEFIITGHTRDYAEQAGLRLQQQCRECGYRKYVYPDQPLVVPEDSWDHSDVFVIEELGVKVVTGAFRDAVERHGHTGIEFTPLSEWQRWWMPQS
jgi:hypothetical protein